MPVAAYAATTEVESTLGDRFTYEISDLRVAERLPYPYPPAGGTLHLEPSAPGRLVTPPPLRRSRRPSNIIPIGAPTDGDVFYLGLDVTFVGTKLGHPGMPATVDMEVKFFLEAYGAGGGESGGPFAGHRHEINIQPQTFVGLNADPAMGLPDNELRHQLWVQVAQSDFPAIIERPAVPVWAHLFNPDTIYRVAAAVKIVGCTWMPLDTPAGTGFIEGLVMQTEAYNPKVI